jgi:hypothetical protein
VVTKPACRSFRRPARERERRAEQSTPRRKASTLEYSDSDSGDDGYDYDIAALDLEVDPGAG